MSLTDEAPEPGVYLLFRKRQLVYVGRSRNPDGRIKAHRRNGRPFDHSLKITCAPEDVAWVETALIQAMNPPQNRLGVVNPRAEEPDEPANPTAAPQGPILTLRDYKGPPPPAVYAVSVAREVARRVALDLEFDADVASGALHSFPKDPSRIGKGSRWLVMRKTLEVWQEAKLEGRARIGWRAA